MRKYRWLSGVLSALALTVSPVAAQEADEAAASIAADVISSILEGEADDAAWIDLEAALGGVSTTVTPLETASAPPPAVDRVTDTARALGETLSGRLAGLPWSIELAGMVAIGLLLAFAVVATLVGATRRARRPAAVSGRGRRDVVRLTARRTRRGRALRHSRDAERLAARLRTRNAA